MDKTFDPAQVEPRWRAAWDEADLFRADPASGKPAYCMVIPPPNITGRLHVGRVYLWTGSQDFAQREVLDAEQRMAAAGIPTLLDNTGRGHVAPAPSEMPAIFDWMLRGN